MDFLEPDWSQAQPTVQEVQSSMGSMEVTPWPLVAPTLERVLSELRASHVNGGALFGRFRIPVDSVLQWFGSRNRWEEISFFEHFLSSEAVRVALPELGLGATARTPHGFTWGSSFTLDGELAQTLVSGGAYERFGRSPSEAKALTGKACEELMGGRFDEVFVFRTHRMVSPWFFDIAWDQAWLGVDKREAAVWLLCVTDTD